MDTDYNIPDHLRGQALDIAQAALAELGVASDRLPPDHSTQALLVLGADVSWEHRFRAANIIRVALCLPQFPDVGTYRDWSLYAWFGAVTS